MNKEYQNVVAAYPVIVSYDANEPNYPYFGHVVDFDSDTTAQSLAELIKMARNAICDEAIARQNAGLEVPAASQGVTPKHATDFVTYVDIDLNKYRALVDARTVKKTVSIPSYLNELGRERGVNFSQLLTNALKTNLNIK